MRLGFVIALAVAFVFSMFTVWYAAIPIGIALAVVVSWPEDLDTREERDAAVERRVQAAVDALRGLGRDYPRPKNY